MTVCHVAFEVLLDYVEGRLDRHTYARVSTHLMTGCQACEEQLEWIGRIIPSLSEAAQSEILRPPVRVLLKAQAIASTPRTLPARHSLPQFIAKLLFDSSSPMVPVGVRGLSSRENKRVYGTDEHFVDLWEEEQPDGRWYQIGQVISCKNEEAQPLLDVELVDGQGNVRLATFEGTEFHIADSDSGIYTMTLHLTDAVIQVPLVRVGR